MGLVCPILGVPDDESPGIVPRLFFDGKKRLRPLVFDAGCGTRIGQVELTWVEPDRLDGLKETVPTPLV